MRLREPALALSSAVAVTAAMLTVAVPQATWLRVPLGAPLVLLLPGYGLTRALFPGATLGRLERVAVSLGLSLALTVLLGFALDVTERGLDRETWMIALASCTLLGNALAYVRAPLAVPAAPMPLPSLAYTALAALAGLALILSVVVASHDALRPASGQLLELWALPASSSRHDDVRIGVRNTLSEWQSFHIVVTHAGTVVADTWLDVPLGETRTFAVRMPPGASRQTPLRAQLTAPAPRSTERIVMIWPSGPATPTPQVSRQR